MLIFNFLTISVLPLSTSLCESILLGWYLPAPQASTACGSPHPPRAPLWGGLTAFLPHSVSGEETGRNNSNFLKCSQTEGLFCHYSVSLWRGSLLGFVWILVAKPRETPKASGDVAWGCSSYTYNLLFPFSSFRVSREVLGASQKWIS